MDQLVSKRYARALLQIALEKNQLNEYLEQINFLRAAFDSSPELIEIFCHPTIMLEEKMQILEGIFNNTVNDAILGLFSVIFKKNRENDIIGILDSFIELANEHNNFVTAYVTSVLELNEQQLNEIKSSLSKKLNKNIEIKHDIDPALIGGLRIIVDEKIFDASIKNNIELIKKELVGNDN